MKRFLLSLTIGILIMLPAIARDFSYTYEGQTLAYTVIDEDAKTCMTREGYRSYLSIRPGNEVSGNLVIPSIAIDDGVEYTVISIGEKSFYRCKNLLSVVIPNSITSIDNMAFENCEAMTSLTIPESVTYIGDCAFYECSGMEKLHFNAENCEYCGKLTLLLIDGTIFPGHDQAFPETLKEIFIGEKVRHIPDYAFLGCSEVSSVTIPKSVTYIGDRAFMDCNGLKEIYTPSIEAWLNIEFGSNLLSSGIKLFINGEMIQNLTIPEGTERINSYAFQNCEQLLTVTFPTSIKSVGIFPFIDCTSLEKFIFPTVESYLGIEYYVAGKHLFGGNESKIYIGSEEFNQEEIEWPATLTRIPNNAFSFNKALKKINIPPTVTEIWEGAFYDCENLSDITIPHGVEVIGSHAFYHCININEINIPNSVTLINECAFESCKGLVTLVIPNSVTHIGESAFVGCSNLTSVVISATSIGYGAFQICTSLTSVEFTNFVKSIGEYAFCNCPNLTTVVIPNSVNSIDNYAFYDCGSLTAVYYNSEEPIELPEGVFMKKHEDATLYVPGKAVEKCKQISPWRYFKNIVAYDFENEVYEIKWDFNADEPFDIYSISGKKLGTSTERLAPGIYIIRQGRKTKKIML